MISLSYAVALTAMGMLLGGAIAWGALRATVDQLRETVRELRDDVTSLRATVSDLRAEVAVLGAVERTRLVTIPHPKQ